MKSNLIILCAFTFLAVSKVTGDEKAEPKLKIGVKKRVENCSIRSKKGDLLSMHYTVRIILFSIQEIKPRNQSQTKSFHRALWKIGQNLIRASLEEIHYHSH